MIQNGLLHAELYGYRVNEDNQVQYIELTLYRSRSIMDFGIARSDGKVDMVSSGKMEETSDQPKLVSPVTGPEYRCMLILSERSYIAIY